jgi:hypothetical protein
MSVNSIQSISDDNQKRMSKMELNAKCLCGAVELVVEFSNSEIAAWLGSLCRKWSGGPMLAIDSGEIKNTLDESLITRFDSSEWAQRGFCSQCGTHLFYYLKPANHYHFPVGIFDTDAAFKLSHQIFIDEKPEYYSFSNDTQNMTGAEVFAYFESDQ